jgi:hypothetical protein
MASYTAVLQAGSVVSLSQCGICCLGQAMPCFGTVSAAEHSTRSRSVASLAIAGGGGVAGHLLTAPVADSPCGVTVPTECPTLGQPPECGGRYLLDFRPGPAGRQAAPTSLRHPAGTEQDALLILSDTTPRLPATPRLWQSATTPTVVT